MRYELRRWTDETKTEYVVRQTSNNYQAIKDQYERALTSSSAPYLNYIVDTERDN